MKRDLPKSIRILRECCNVTNCYCPFKSEMVLNLAEMIFNLSGVEWDNPDMMPPSFGIHRSDLSSRLSESLLLLSLHDNLIKQPRNGQPPKDTWKAKFAERDCSKKGYAKLFILVGAGGSVTDLLRAHAENQVKEDQSNALKLYNLALTAYADERLEDALQACRKAIRSDVKIHAADCPKKLDVGIYLQYIKTSAIILASKLAIRLEK